MGERMSIANTPEGATPLSPDDLRGLIPSHYTTRAQLDAHEQANILQARSWSFKSRTFKSELITFSGLMLLHKRMFDDTWELAGKMCKTQTNIGVETPQISTELHKLTGDVSYWLEHETYPLVELAVRFHHRLVWIHPFPNGNGRHARLAADLLMYFRGGTELTWGGRSLSAASDVRKQYISALRQADQHHFNNLIQFACS